MRVDRVVALPLLALLMITKFSVAARADGGPGLLLSSGEDETFRSHFNPSNGQNPKSIPFRQVRRIGSEFLGKRSDPWLPLVLEETPAFEPAADKRALGSEFLGKRRLGSEFLGKRSGERSWDDDEQWDAPPSTVGLDESSPNYIKRASASQYVGRRRQGPWDWAYKRGLGSEFLGKRVLGSEFLGKRSAISEPQPTL